MSSTEPLPTGPGDGRSVDHLDRALRDASTPTRTRRWLLERAAVGAAGIAAASAAIPAGDALADSRRGSVEEFGVFASTTEALTTTILNELVRRTTLHPEVPTSVARIFDGIYAAERDHWLFIRKLFRPTTTRFWIPDAFYGGAGNALDLTSVGKGTAAGEHLFVNTYLVGVTTCAAAGNSKLARYSAELAGIESEHRVLGQFLAGASPPDNLGFAEFEFHTVAQIKSALKSAGFGLGEQGTAAGRFYDLPSPPPAPPVAISSNRPR